MKPPYFMIFRKFANIFDIFWPIMNSLRPNRIPQYSLFTATKQGSKQEPFSVDLSLPLSTHLVPQDTAPNNGGNLQRAQGGKKSWTSAAMIEIQNIQY